MLACRLGVGLVLAWCWLDVGLVLAWCWLGVGLMLVLVCLAWLGFTCLAWLGHLFGLLGLFGLACLKRGLKYGLICADTHSDGLCSDVEVDILLYESAASAMVA